MQTKITVIYAYRNRDSERVRLSLQSLQKQSYQNFDVQFVDYGSEHQFAEEIEDVVKRFSFATYHYIAHEGLLWNKSKALNYGIQNAQGQYVFIADVDILFHPNTMSLFEAICNEKTAFLFNLSYLDKSNSLKINSKIEFESLPIKHSGKVNGMVLVSKKAITNIYGYDNFFHFYGSEDVDLHERLKNIGLSLVYRDELYFKHIWHKIYNTYDDSQMSLVPRLYNVKRINQEHYFFNKTHHIKAPINQENWEHVILKNDLKGLMNPDKIIELSNIHSVVTHFFEVELDTYKNRVVKIILEEDNYYKSLKYKIKRMLNKQTVFYMSIKQMNDLVLSKIIYKYRDYNYSYNIASNLKCIIFTIKL